MIYQLSSNEGRPLRHTTSTTPSAPMAKPRRSKVGAKLHRIPQTTLLRPRKRTCSWKIDGPIVILQPADLFLENSWAAPCPSHTTRTSGVEGVVEPTWLHFRLRDDLYSLSGGQRSTRGHDDKGLVRWSFDLLLKDKNTSANKVLRHGPDAIRDEAESNVSDRLHVRLDADESSGTKHR